ncbi:MAG: TlyA family RNA methyltransferase [Verrucomicrobiota bacterium]|nr:TlyA family RNA methyltransferase [Verrucomicrobiota bacterium]
MTRLDQALVERGLCESRERAKRAILAGMIRINEQVAQKASDKVKSTDIITLQQPERYVSRGGYKLEHAISLFGVNVQDSIAADLGASTGGFTDCLLQHGAKKVYAVDVGQGQLSWKLRQDPRVIVMERTNARDLIPQRMPQPFTALDLVVIDCSFISLEKILPAAVALLRSGGTLVALVKPQFEAGKAEVDRGEGVITDPAIHQRVLEKLRNFVEQIGSLRWVRDVESPLIGPAGNKEFLALIQKL